MFTSARKTRKRLLYLSSRGVGVKVVAEITGLDRELLMAYKNGRIKRLRPENERLVMSINKAARINSSLIPATKTVQLLEKLKADGFTKTVLARRLTQTRKLHIGQGQRVRASTEMKVERFYNLLNLAA